MREEIKSIKTSQEKQINDLSKKYDDQIRSIQGELDDTRKLIQSLADQMKLKDDKNKAQDDFIQKLMNDKNDIQNGINKLEKYHKCNTFEYVKGHEFEGIFNYLNGQCGGNSHLNGLVNVTSSGDEKKHCYNLLDGNYGSDKYFYTNCHQDSYVQFDFKEHKVSINKYSFLHEQRNYNKLINWELVGSNDEKKWDQIDERHINEWSGPYDLSTYSTNNNEFYKYIRLRLKGKTSTNEYYLILTKIEFFGKFI